MGMPLGPLAQLRRLYHHLVNGGKLNSRDLAYIQGCIDDYGIDVTFNGSKKSLSEVISAIEKAHT